MATRGIHVHALSDRGAILATLNPSFVVVYDPDAAFIREIETHKASRPGAPMRVYHAVHDTSLEEQLITSPSRLSHAEARSVRRSRPHETTHGDARGAGGRVGGGTRSRRNWAGRRVDDARAAATQLRRRLDRAKGIAGAQHPRARPDSSPCRRGCVVVDVREFMSSLPSILHQSAFKLMPVTLEVGDYVLNPDICVERKSVPDLIGSL